MYNTDLFTPDVSEHGGFIYMMDILERRTISCESVFWACQRQYNDLLNAHERGFYFSSDMADITIDTLREYKHWEGENFAGTYFEPTPPQLFSLWVIFGWYHMSNDRRRFRESYKEVARKYGKTFESSCIGVYMLEGDGEAGAQSFTAATKLSQAKIAHESAKNIIIESDFLSDKVRVLRDNLSILATHSKYVPLGQDAKTEDGLNPHYACVDEYHAHPNSDMYDVLTSAMGSRTQPLLYVITTAGTNPQGPCYLHRDYILKILDPNNPIENDAIFGIIYTLDKDDDPFDENVWEKANPNMPYIDTVFPYSQTQAKKAKDKPSDLVTFKTKNLNIWCSADNPWIQMDKWMLNNKTFDVRDLIGKPCYGGLDLASVNDLTALDLVFPPEQESIASQRKRFRDVIVKKIRESNTKLNDHQFSFLLDDKEPEIEDELRLKTYIIPDPYQIIPYFFVPKDNINERSKAHGVRYDLCQEDKSCNFFATPGPVTDYDFVEYEIDKLNARYDIREIAYDPHNASMLVQNLLNKNYECVEIIQSWSNMSWASKELEMLYLMGLLSHNNNPVLNWNAENVIIHTGPSGNYKPDKNKSKEKIDGIISLIMALNRAIMNENATTKSVYEERGVLIL